MVWKLGVAEVKDPVAKVEHAENAATGPTTPRIVAMPSTTRMFHASGLSL